MSLRVAVVAMFAAACGTVANTPPIDGAAADAPPDSVAPTTYAVQVDMIPAVMFGGAPTCTFTITLKQLDVELAILPSGEVVSGRVQDLNMEDVLNVPPCTPQTGHIEPNIVTYTFTSAQPGTGGTMLSFHGATTNKPQATLVATLAPAGAAYTAMLKFQRTDGIPAVNWLVMTMVTLSPK